MVNGWENVRQKRFGDRAFSVNGQKIFYLTHSKHLRLCKI